MRLRHPTGRVVHLSYEISPRPARRLPALVSQLDTHAAVRTMIGADTLGVSFWLPPALAAALAVGGRLRTRLRNELDARKLEVVTLSGLSFDEETGSPFAEGGGGHQPGWDEPARREYTLDLARVLVDLLPDETVRGAIGTIGLAPRDDWGDGPEKAGAGILRRLSAGLADLAWQNGRAVRVGFQPAPGWVLDRPEHIAAAFARIDKDRLGIRLDLDHALRTWPDPVAGIDTLTDAGLSIVEVRLTAAPGTRIEAWRDTLTRLLGPDGPQTEYLTLTGSVDDPSADQIASDYTYLQAELAALGLAPEHQPCPAR